MSVTAVIAVIVVIVVVAYSNIFFNELANFCFDIIYLCMCVLEVWQSTTETRVCKKNRLTLSTLGKIASDTARKVPISTASAAKKKQQEYLDYFRLNTVCRPAEIARDRLNCSMYTYTLTLQVAQRG